MNLKTKLALIAIFVINISLFAQDSYTVTGKVTSSTDGTPLPGVTVLIKGTSTGTSTDFDGIYTIEVVNGNVLQFSYISYLTKSITISGQTTVDVVLVEDVNNLDEVVVVGYGTQKKSFDRFNFKSNE